MAFFISPNDVQISIYWAFGDAYKTGAKAGPTTRNRAAVRARNHFK
jgi:hypothetical protein